MGSSYLYAYVVYGEIMAFILGWNLIMESVMSVALAGLALSQHLNVLSSGRMNTAVRQLMGGTPWEPDQPPQIVAVGLIALVASAAICRNKNGTLTIHSCLFVLHILVIIAVAFLAMFHVSSDNWGSDETFFRPGSHGIMSAAALLISSANGIKSIAMAAEETRKPSRNIPLTHTLTVMITSVTLFVLSCLITLSIDASALSDSAPILDLFDTLRVKNAKYFIGGGAICGFLLAINTQLNYAERMLFCMARDGLLPQWFHKWSYGTNTPWSCRLCVTLAACIITLTIRYDWLLQSVSIGSIMGFAVTCLATISVRYDPCQIGLAAGNPLRKTVSADSFILSRASSQMSNESDLSTSTSRMSQKSSQSRESVRLKELTTLLAGTADKATSTGPYGSSSPPSSSISPAESVASLPSLQSYNRITRALWIFVVSSIILAITIAFGHSVVDSEWDWLWVILSVTCIFITVCCSLAVFRGPANGMPLVYSVGGMPFLPMLAFTCLVVMMFHLSVLAWLRLIVWSSAGFVIYFLYSRRRSQLGRPVEEELMSYENRGAANSV
ncbi:cationic amino acid transporter 3-like isoform X2 [Paramacrobiotus metropolitanus]|nr:cationic amino acid transporter 3-like isoform X2 [Paramacrobiotus metropolitanus]